MSIKRMSEWFSRRRQPDPVLVTASQVFEQHSQAMLDQARAFVQAQYAGHQGQGNVNPTVEAELEPGPTYVDFMRYRRNSLARKLMADTRLQEFQEGVSRTETVRQLERRKAAAQVQANQRQAPSLSRPAGYPSLAAESRIEPTPDKAGD